MRDVATIVGLLLGGIALSGSRGAEPALPVPTEDAGSATTTLVEVSPKDDPPAPTTVSAATRYASLPREDCFAELDSRGVEYVRVDRPDVDAPVRIVGPVSGVRVRTLRPKEERARTPYEIVDCRLVLALDDFAKILVRHGIVDVMYYSMFRPLVPGGSKRGHESGLAIDVAFFGRADGTAYSILRDFTPIANELPCNSMIRAAGPRELREIVCQAVDEKIFHVALTPDYDAPHRDHLHLEIVPGEVRSYAR